jgi:dihydroorotate dehydrogenase electron transfer subunit
LKQRSAPILSSNELMSGIFLMTIEAPETAAVAKPGQFVMMNCGTQLLLNRPLSIHRVEDSYRVSFLYSIVGQGTLNLSQMNNNEIVQFIGPLGNHFSINAHTQNLLLVAGGMGIAPLVFLAEYAISQGKSVTLLVGASTASKGYPGQLLPRVDRLAVTTEDGTYGIKGKITDVVYDYIGNTDQIFACGPVSMYRTIFELMNSKGLEKQVQVSMEVRMGCGMGLCYGCSIKTRDGMRMVCHDGPVFNLDKVFWGADIS